jgi:hypothetical protein
MAAEYTHIPRLSKEEECVEAKPTIPPSDNAASVKVPFRQSALLCWRIEIGSTILSLISIISMIVVLYSQQGKPLADWTFFLSLNTLISVLGVICRASVAFAVGACIGQQKWNWLRVRQDQLVAFQRFDAASRGPEGCVQLLFFLRVK